MSTYLDAFKEDFDVIITAAQFGQLALVECKNLDGTPCAAICVTQGLPDGNVAVIPVAVMPENVIDKLLPPEIETKGESSDG